MFFYLSIIIPTYNEENNVGPLINYLKKNDPQNQTEIIVCDGQSTDNTVEVAIKAGAKVISSSTKGRAAQMNHAAAFANADVMFFIHSDCFPATSFILDIPAAIKDGYDLGRYRTKFISGNILLKINAWFTRFDWLICYGGDQTLFITKKLFEKIGGFNNDMIIMEDYDIVKRARRFANYKIFKKSALISARKYDVNSWLKVQLANRQIMKMFKKGSTQEEMMEKYGAMLN